MSKEISPKEAFIRSHTTFLCSESVTYYRRGDRVYIDTAPLQGRGLMLLEGIEFKSFLLRLAKQKDNLMLRMADAELLIDHVRYYAAEVARPLSADARAAFVKGKLILNAGWGDEFLVIEENGMWSQMKLEERIFEPMPQRMQMVQPVMTEPGEFPGILKTGIADFGDYHCLLCVTCATMLLPATFSHPFLVFTGNQARGKSTTMKLLVQLVDPYENGELMTIGEDLRDFIALTRTRHSVALDNVSKLPFDEDLLSKMYSGGLFAARTMRTNAEVTEVEMPRLRVLMNGIGNAFSRSDLMSRCIFLEHPVLTKVDEKGIEQYQTLTLIEERWKALLPSALGSLLRALGSGLKLFRSRGGYDNKTSGSRFAEFCILGECIAEEMGFPAGLFTEQVNAAATFEREAAIDADDCAQLVLSWLNGERVDSSYGNPFEEAQTIFSSTGEIVISPTELFSEIRALAAKRQYSTFAIKWLASVKSFSQAILRSSKNIENGGWTMTKYQGGENKRKLKFDKKN